MVCCVVQRSVLQVCSYYGLLLYCVFEHNIILKLDYFFFFFFQILMNVQRTLMAASRCAQTLMVLLSAPVGMATVLAVIRGAVTVSVC